MTLESGSMVAGYVIGDRLGAGGFGEVYRARHPVIEREVAIKLLHVRYSADPDAVARFVAEARVVNQISHAGIVEIFAFGEHDGRALFVMELLHGKTLRELLAERGHLPLAEALPILRGIAEAVDAAHAAGVAHRDLKPDNVFVQADGTIKLIDFGLAKLTGAVDAPVTATGAVLGTPLYMSPEQCRGRAIGPRTDAYSFGALAYHVLVGEPPFTGEPLELALHHLNDPAPAASTSRRELPRHVDRVLLALLAKAPADRPMPLATAVAALDGSTTLRRRLSRRAKRWGLIAIPVAVLAVGVGAVASRHTAAATVETCVPAAQRLFGIWDPIVRTTIRLRFEAVGRPNIQATWHYFDRTLERLTAAWTAQWDATCRADPDEDRLLHVQRQTCLENTLLELRGSIEALTTANVGDARNVYMGDVEWPYGRSIADCANDAVLRTQVAAPSPAVRDQVSALLLEAYRAISDMNRASAARNRAELDRAVAHTDRIARTLEVLDPPAAEVPILARAESIEFAAWDVDVRRVPEAREALDDAIRRLEASRDAVAIADAYVAKEGFELAVDRDSDALPRAAETHTRAETAVAFAGRPTRASKSLADDRAILALARGRYDDAIAASRAASAIDPEGGRWRHSLVEAYTLLGRERDALVEADREIAHDAEVNGTDAAWLAPGYFHRILVREHAGDIRGALADQRFADRSRAPWGYADAPHAPFWGAVFELDLALRAGEPGDPAARLAVVTALAAKGTTPAGQSPDGFATARRAGLYATYAFAVDAAAPPRDGRDPLADSAAILAFWRGDDAATAKLAGIVARDCAAPHACSDWLRFSRWLAVLADANAGHAAAVDRRLAELEADSAIAPAAALASSGIVLASLGRWTDARKKLEAARAMPSAWEHQSDTVELDAWLALARLATGDAAHARPMLEQALAIFSITNSQWGLSYMTPRAELALAAIVWDANERGDRDRARRLATQARIDFARLGPFRARDADEAKRWLESHT